MNILFVSSGLAARFGGAAVSESELAASLQRVHAVRVLCPFERLDEGFAREKGLKDIRSLCRKDVVNAVLSRVHWLSNLIDDSHVVHFNGHWRWENDVMAQLCRTRQIPYVLHPRGMLWVGHRRVLAKKLFNLVLGRETVNNAACVIALSRFETRHFIPYKVPQERVFVLPNGVSSVSLPPLERGSDFLYLGRLESRKNLLFLVDAFAQYVRCGGSQILRLVGPVEHGYDVALREKIVCLGLGDRVQVEPPMYGRDKWRALAEAMALIYPSQEEPFGRVPFEAVAVGTWPIVPDASGAAEYLAPFLPQCVYREKDVASLTQALFEAERQGKASPSLQKARDWVRQELSWEQIAGRLNHCYEQITVSGRHAA